MRIAFAQPRLPRIAILLQPLIPFAACVVRFLEKLTVAVLLSNLPRRCGDRDDHLNLSESHSSLANPAGHLPVFTLQGKKEEMIVARHIGSNRSIYERLVRSALQPGALIIGAFDQYWLRIICKSYDVRSKCPERMRIHGLVSRIASFKESDFKRIKVGVSVLREGKCVGAVP